MVEGSQSADRRGPATKLDSHHDLPSSIVEPPSEPLPPRVRGDRVGRYVVVDTIGHGGMGVVYAAWDPQLDRRIALKLVSLRSRAALATDGDSHRLRLLREAQALARLEHPNVVKVHDVGVCRSGEYGAIGEEQVFIAMEQIVGRSLRDWLREQRRGLGLGAVLEVFLAAGRGLAAAHEAGLVHRDFKPDNVLVGDSGEVKVVDFGLARDSQRDGRREDRPRAREWAETEPAVAAALGRTNDTPEITEGGVPVAVEPEPSAGHSLGSHRSLLSSTTGNITASGTVLGTPAYMAPEQHARATVDARSDQYAFCLSLWEAVYGKRPFSGRRSELLAKRKRKLQIRESSRGLRVPRWLRSLLLRGISSAPERRFASMDELLAELEGNLRRTTKLRRRWLISAALLSIALVLGAVASSSMVGSESPAPCAAPIERLAGVWDDARRVEVKQAVLASDLAYARDTWVRVAAGLDEYRERWLAAEVEACEATQLRHEHDPEWLEHRLACLDDRRRALASLTEQLGHSDARTVEHAARAVGSLAPIEACEHDQSPADLIPLPDDAHLRLRVERQLDQLADARSQISSGHLEQGLAAARKILASRPSRQWPALAAETQFVIGQVQADVEGDHAAEHRSLHAAASEALRAGHHRLAALAWSRLARGLIETRQFAEAERWLAHAEGLVAELTHDSGADARGDDPTLAADLEYTRARLRFAQKDFAAAELHARRRLALLREFYGPDNPRVADGLNNLGVTVYMQYRKDEAVDAYREALAILERVQGPDHPSVATMHNNIGVVSTDRQRYAEALAHYQRAVEIRRRVYPRTHELVLQSLRNLANLHLFAGADYQGNMHAGIGPALEILLASAERIEVERTRLIVTGISAGDGPEIAALEVQLVPDLLRLGRLFAGAGEHRNALVSFGRALALIDASPNVRLPPGFEAPAKGEAWPPHLDGCRADLLLGIESSARALGRDDDAEAALRERSSIPVKQPSYLRRCIDELAIWSVARVE